MCEYDNHCLQTKERCYASWPGLGLIQYIVLYEFVKINPDLISFVPKDLSANTRETLRICLYVCLSVCLSLSLSLTHTHSHTLTHTNTHTHTHTQLDKDQIKPLKKQNERPNFLLII